MHVSGAVHRRCRAIAIVMDGNGRWRQPFMPRVLATSRRRHAWCAVPLCAARGHRIPDVFAFSSENWNARDEVSGLMNLVLVAVPKCPRC